MINLGDIYTDKAIEKELNKYLTPMDDPDGLIRYLTKVQMFEYEIKKLLISKDVIRAVDSEKMTMGDAIGKLKPLICLNYLNFLNEVKDDRNYFAHSYFKDKSIKNIIGFSVHTYTDELDFSDPIENISKAKRKLEIAIKIWIYLNKNNLKAEIPQIQ